MKLSTEPRISWQIEEYNHKEKNPDWFWALGVIALASAIIAIIYHDALFAVIIIMGAIMMGYYAARKPDIIEVAISEAGINFKDIFMPFESMLGFSIEEHFMGNKLIIETNRKIIPMVYIPIPNNLDPEGLRELISTKVVQKNLSEPIGHKIFENLGF